MLIRILACASLTLGAFGSVFAADHLDSDSVTSDKATDITDLFAWMDSGGEKVNLIMNVFPLAGEDAAFSDSARYVFNIKSGASVGADTTTTVQIICTFNSSQTISCWGPGDTYVTGDASTSDGITSSDGVLKVYAGKRNDPFSFNFEGFTDNAALVKSIAGDLTFADSGCPTLSDAQQTTVVSYLQGTNDGADDPEDFFTGSNVLSIVIQVNKDAIDDGGDIIGFSAATHSAPSK